MKEIIKIVLGFWLEIILGILILFNADDIRWFLLYFFVIFLIVSARQTDYIRKLVRVFQVFNEIKLLAIIRKLKITDDEISIVADGEKRNMGEEKWKEIEKEFNDLSAGR